MDLHGERPHRGDASVLIPVFSRRPDVRSLASELAVAKDKAYRLTSAHGGPIPCEQYGAHGAIRLELDAVLAYRAACRIDPPKPKRKPVSKPTESDQDAEFRRAYHVVVGKQRKEAR